MARPKKSAQDYFDKIESDLKANQPTLSLILGALIVLIVAVLIFNYFNRQKAPEVGPAQETLEGDVSPEKLPGKYTVKEGDSLFIIAQKYYKDGYKYPEIVKANNLSNPDIIEVGQVLEIPKVEMEIVEASPSPQAEAPAIGGGDTTIWGPKIEGDTYTIVEGDWLSTIAARAYGDIMAYPKIAQANNIQNPDLIYPETTIKLPR